MTATTPEQKKRLLKAKIAVALQDELGRVPKEEEIDRVFLLTQGSRIRPVYPYEGSTGSPEVSSFAKLSRLRESQSLRNQPQA